VACPFFMPEEQFVSDWPFPQRLPLGAGWMGTCTAPGHEGRRPSDEELKSGCNLGYAKACSRLYDAASGSWLQRHDDPRVQRMAECYVQAQKARTGCNGS